MGPGGKRVAVRQAGSTKTGNVIYYSGQKKPRKNMKTLFN